jgi:hypothetical protein
MCRDGVIVAMAVKRNKYRNGALPEYCVDRDRKVGIATGYGLGGPGIASQWGARFSSPIQTDAGFHPVSYRVGTGSIFLG